MTSTFTPNKSLEKPASGDYVNAWATPVNADWDAIDASLGGSTFISVTSVPGGIITLTLSQYRPPNIEFTGTLTANLNYQLPTGIGGVWSVNNATTGAFALNFSIAAGNSIALSSGRTSIVSNGTKLSVTDQKVVLYPQNSAEQAANVTPVNFNYPWGNVLRYGAVGNGSTDDSIAVGNALKVAGGSSPVVIPDGYTFKITQYLQIFSNTVIHWYGTVDVSNRASGFFSNNATNIGIYGFNVGLVTDTSVASNYDWNHASGVFTLIAPAIHIRSSTNVTIDGLVGVYLCEGIQLSNANANTAVGASWQLTQAAPVDCVVSNCNMTFCELGGITGYSMADTRYVGNYVYRCGDGGLWMMGAVNFQIIDNVRVSPYATPSDVAIYGTNILQHPTTWNDEQGIQLEACQGGIVARNEVRGFWAQGIDIKNDCNRVLVSENQVSDCENGSIVVREGDATKNACHKVSIIGNTISGHGTLQFNIPNGIFGAIRVGECFINEIISNVIYAYQTTPAINCQGPGTWQATWYGSNPHQGSLVVENNTFDFKNPSFELETPPEIQFNSATLGAIVVNGQYDSVTIVGNKVSADRYLASDARINTAPAIGVNQVNANSAFYPTSMIISNNQVSNWGFHGIVVAGFFAATYSGITITGNALGNCAGSGIRINTCHKAVINGNNINQPGSGAGWPGIDIAGSSGNNIDGVVCTNNSITGRFDGTNAMTYAIHTDYAQNINLSNNVMAGAAFANFQFDHIQGDHVMTGSTGFPRSAPASPNGTVTAYYRGEQFFDTTGHWWAASQFNTTVWTQLS